MYIYIYIYIYIHPFGLQNKGEHTRCEGGVRSLL